MPTLMDSILIIASISIVQLFFIPKNFNKLRLLLLTNVPTLLFIIYNVVDLILTKMVRYFHLDGLFLLSKFKV